LSVVVRWVKLRSSSSSFRQVGPCLAPNRQEARPDPQLQLIRETITKQLIPDTKIDMTFERRRPPLELNASAAAIAKHAQTIYAEIGKELKVTDTVAGGGTDAAFAALGNTKPVIERFGLLSFGAHSNDNEYIHIDSIEPRLYLATRLIMDVSRGRVN
jgi:glutamate carboxypeptidase